MKQKNKSISRKKKEKEQRAQKTEQGIGKSRSGPILPKYLRILAMYEPKIILKIFQNLAKTLDQASIDLKSADTFQN